MNNSCSNGPGPFSKSFSKSFSTLTMALLLLPASGCDLSLLMCSCMFGEVSGGELLTPGADAVEADADRYAADSTHPLLAVPRGTVIEDLSHLNGCWGTIIETEIFEIGTIHAVQFIHLDFAAGRIELEDVSRDGTSNRVVRSKMVGFVRLGGPDRLAIRWCGMRTVDSGTPEGSSPSLPPSDTAVPMPTQEVEILISLDGDAMRWGDPSVPSGLDYVLLRTGCPSDNAGAAKLSLDVSFGDPRPAA